MKLPFWFGLGGKIGDGKQLLPWIHIDDLCDLIKFSIENKNVNGVLNGVAPQIITNEDFTKVTNNLVQIQFRLMHFFHSYSFVSHEYRLSVQFCDDQLSVQHQVL